MTDTETPDSAVHQVEIPPFFCPIDPVMHPPTPGHGGSQRAVGDANGVVPNQGTVGAVAGHALGRPLRGNAPQGIVERQQVPVGWFYWIFSFDDHRCDKGSNAIDPVRLIPVASRLLRILETQDAALCGQDPYLLGCWAYATWPGATASWAPQCRHDGGSPGTTCGCSAPSSKTPTAHGGLTSIDDYIATRIHMTV